MMCPDCGAIAHDGECTWIEATCCECGETFECGDAKYNLCPECKSFLDERESRAMGWAEAMEATNERRH